MDTLQLKNFDDKIAELDKKIEQFEKKLDSLRKEREAISITKESFFGKERNALEKKNVDIDVLLNILRDNGSIHYRKICELFNAACGTNKTEGAIFTLLSRLIKSKEAPIEKDPSAGKGFFRILTEKGTGIGASSNEGSIN